MEKTEFIKIRIHRFRISEIVHYKCVPRSNYTGYPPVIVVWKSRIKDGVDILFREDSKNLEKEYQKTKRELDELFLGQTEEETGILP